MFKKIGLAAFISCLFIIPLVITSHQLTRIFVFSAVAERGAQIEVLPFFNLVEVWNSGISFGMLGGLAYGQWLLSAVAIIIVFFMLRWLLRTDDRFIAVALSFIIGGAVGNTIDRLRFGAVADYLDFYAFEYHWPAFNLTDVAIFVGVCLLILRETGILSKLYTKRLG
jgi:signal peptidase II